MRLQPVFQPIFDLERGVACGFEMLARFDSDRQAAPPEWFTEATRAASAPIWRRSWSGSGSTRATRSRRIAS